MVWFEGSGSAQTLYRGMGVCLNSDYGTATSADFKRTNRVELPKDANDLFFVGVLARDYTIPATGCMVEVDLPGSATIIRLTAGVSTTVASSVCVCVQDTGLWNLVGAETGKGTARALQTITGGGSALECMAVLEEGAQSGLEAD
jgi:hypothetical protein